MSEETEKKLKKDKGFLEKLTDQVAKSISLRDERKYAVERRKRMDDEMINALSGAPWDRKLDIIQGFRLDNAIERIIDAKIDVATKDSDFYKNMFNKILYLLMVAVFGLFFQSLGLGDILKSIGG